MKKHGLERLRELLDDEKRVLPGVWDTRLQCYRELFEAILEELERQKPK